MPHVHKTYRKKEEKKIYPMSKKKNNTKREIDHPMEFIHYPPKKLFHTLEPLDQVV